MQYARMTGPELSTTEQRAHDILRNSRTVERLLHMFTP
jgi:hypothetical protein